MEINPDLVSPKQVARAIGVSESSLKHWCDKGLIKTVRTSGGYRKMAIAQERRACETALRLVWDLRRIQEVPTKKWLATGGAIEADLYSLPTAMTELVLRDCGFYAVSLGTSIPFSSPINAVHETRPKFFWLSVAHIREGLDFSDPVGLLGLAYWYALYPLHHLVFYGMLRNIARAAENRAYFNSHVRSFVEASDLTFRSILPEITS